MAEVPEALDAQLDELIGQRGGLRAGDAEHGHLGQVFTAELVQPVHMADRKTPHHLAGQGFLLVEDADELEAPGLKGHVGRDGPAQVSRADEDGLAGLVQAQNQADFPK